MLTAVTSLESSTGFDIYYGKFVLSGLLFTNVFLLVVVDDSRDENLGSVDQNLYPILAQGVK